MRNRNYRSSHRILTRAFACGECLDELQESLLGNRPDIMDEGIKIKSICAQDTADIVEKLSV